MAPSSASLPLRSRSGLRGAGGGAMRLVALPAAAARAGAVLARDAAHRSPFARRAMIAATAVAVLAPAGWLALRDSSLVAVRTVRIVGVRGDQAAVIRSALTDAARGMTTMDVDTGRLRAAIAPYTAVASLSVSTSFPHAMTITVRQRLPVAVLTAAGTRVAVAGDGTLLRSVRAPDDVPALPVATLPAAARVVAPAVGGELAVLDAAPLALLHRVHRIGRGRRGLEVDLRRGPILYFGTPAQAGAKWAAAVRVLADADAAGASYVDLRLPFRPAAGGLGVSAPGLGGTTVTGTAAAGGAPGATATGPGGTGSAGGADLTAGGGPATSSSASADPSASAAADPHGASSGPTADASASSGAAGPSASPDASAPTSSSTGAGGG